MAEEYDVVIMGTGLKQCILSGLLSVISNKKVLLIDRNAYPGGDSPTLNLQQVCEYFGSLDRDISQYGEFCNWNVNLLPKLMLKDGLLIKLFDLDAVGNNDMEYRDIEGYYVYKTGEQGGEIHRVPFTEAEITESNLMDHSEKNALQNFLYFVLNLEEIYPQHLDLTKITMCQLYEKFKLHDVDIQDLLGHCIALRKDDDYLNQPAVDTINRIRSYSNSLTLNSRSPFVYPLSKPASVQDKFSRIHRHHGGKVVLQKRFKGVASGNDGKVTGVNCRRMTVKCKQLVADPSYLPGKWGKTKKVGKVVRAICLLRECIPNTNNSKSCHIIIPHNQVGRRNDIYVVCLSHDHNVCDSNWFTAVVSTRVETDHPEEELKPGVALLGPVYEKFVSVSDIYEPIDDGRYDNIFVCSSDDATSHFRTTSEDIIRIFEDISNAPFDQSCQEKIQEEFQKMTDTIEFTCDEEDEEFTTTSL